MSIAGRDKRADPSCFYLELVGVRPVVRYECARDRGTTLFFVCVCVRHFFAPLLVAIIVTAVQLGVDR